MREVEISEIVQGRAICAPFFVCLKQYLVEEDKRVDPSQGWWRVD